MTEDKCRKQFRIIQKHLGTALICESGDVVGKAFFGGVNSYPERIYFLEFLRIFLDEYLVVRLPLNRPRHLTSKYLFIRQIYSYLQSHSTLYNAVS